MTIYSPSVLLDCFLFRGFPYPVVISYLQWTNLNCLPKECMELMCKQVQVVALSEGYFQRQSYGCQASQRRSHGVCRSAASASLAFLMWSKWKEGFWRMSSFAICPFILALLLVSHQQSWSVSLRAVWRVESVPDAKLSYGKVFFSLAEKVIVVYTWLHNRIYCSQIVCREFCLHLLPACCGSSSGGKLISAEVLLLFQHLCLKNLVDE